MAHCSNCGIRMEITYDRCSTQKQHLRQVLTFQQLTLWGYFHSRFQPAMD